MLTWFGRAQALGPLLASSYCISGVPNHVFLFAYCVKQRGALSTLNPKPFREFQFSGVAKKDANAGFEANAKLQVMVLIVGF